jgi:hypothetical protein
MDTLRVLIVLCIIPVIPVVVESKSAKCRNLENSKIKIKIKKCKMPRIQEGIAEDAARINSVKLISSSATSLRLHTRIILILRKAPRNQI